MQTEISLRDAKARLSEILDRVAAGEQIEIVRRGSNPGRFRILPADGAARLRRPGALRGRIEIPEDFDAEDADLIGLFEGE